MYDLMLWMVDNLMKGYTEVSNLSVSFFLEFFSSSTPYSLQPGQGVMPFVPGMPPRPDRSPSFEDPGIPHSSSDSSTNAYGAGAGPQGWGYGAPPADAYGNNSNLSQRPSGPYPGQQGGQYRHPPQFAGPYGGHYGFPTTSPGPPIQTTSSNKGPDGANLFIFHIPNHFTNLDMYHLFSPYGNLLSVRIMVEKDSGRSRGFGFVSYDNPDAAALAIKELNGFAVSLHMNEDNYEPFFDFSMSSTIPALDICVFICYHIISDWK